MMNTKGDDDTDLNPGAPAHFHPFTFPSPSARSRPAVEWPRRGPVRQIAPGGGFMLTYAGMVGATGIVSVFSRLPVHPVSMKANSRTRMNLIL
jgi:hypothetical protein